MVNPEWRKRTSLLEWLCPSCQEGKLRVAPDTLQEAFSRAERPKDDEDSHWYWSKRFVALMKCDSSRCGETATLSGNRVVQREQDFDGDEFEVTSYEVTSITPSPFPFPVSSSVPKAIKALLQETGAVFWVNDAAAASKCREVVEAILTDQKVPTEGANGASLRLHSRIELFAAMECGRWAEGSGFNDGSEMDRERRHT